MYENVSEIWYVQYMLITFLKSQMIMMTMILTQMALSPQGNSSQTSQC